MTSRIPSFIASQPWRRFVLALAALVIAVGGLTAYWLVSEVTSSAGTSVEAERQASVELGNTAAPVRVIIDTTELRTTSEMVASINLRNAGSSDLSALTVGLAEPVAGIAVKVDNADRSVEPGSSAVITVRISRSAPGEFSPNRVVLSITGNQQS